MEQHQPNAQDAIALTKQLITIPSVSDDEAEILSFVAKWMKQAGFDQVITKERFTAGLIRGKSKASQPADKALLLCGHIDTVPAGDESAWQGSPWQPRTKGDRLYGLGASDMKSGVAIQMITGQSYLTERRDDLDLWCVAVALSTSLKMPLTTKLAVSSPSRLISASSWGTEAIASFSYYLRASPVTPLRRVLTVSAPCRP